MGDVPRPIRGGALRPRKFYEEGVEGLLALAKARAREATGEAAHRRSADRQLGKKASTVHAAPLGCETLWRWFDELDMGRASGSFGPSKLTYQDVAAWCTLMGAAPSPLEVRILLSLDAAFLSEVARTMPKTAKG